MEQRRNINAATTAPFGTRPRIAAQAAPGGRVFRLPIGRGGGGGGGEEVGGGVGVLTALRRHRLLSAGIVAGGLLLAVGAIRVMPTLYEGTTEIQIDPRRPALPGAAVEDTSLPPSEETVRKNEVALLRSRALAASVVEELGLVKQPEFNAALRSPGLIQSMLEPLRGAPGPVTAEQAQDRVVNAFLDRVVVRTGDATRIVTLAFRSEDPERAATIANALANRFIAAKLDRDLSVAQGRAESLTAEIEAHNGTIRDTERRIAEMRRAGGLAGSRDRAALELQVADLDRRLIAATGARFQAEAELAALRGDLADPVGAARALDSPMIQRLVEEQTLLRARVEQMASTVGERHPDLIAARSQLAELQRRIRDEATKVASSQSGAVRAARATEESLRRQLDTVRRDLVAARDSEVDVAVLEREVEGERSRLADLSARLSATTALVEQLKVQGPEVSVLSAAGVPLSPVLPRRSAILAAALVISIAAAALTALLLERNNPTVQSQAQIRRLAGVRALGVLPEVSGGLGRLGHSLDVEVSRPGSALSENIRAVALHLDALGPGPSGSILVTSAMVDEGKSSAAAALACSLARAGRRTLLIDLDLRAPSLHGLLRLPPAAGVREHLADGRPWEELVRKVETTGLHVLSAGRGDRPAADLLQSPHLSTMLATAVESYDVVVVDAPPVLAAYDAQLVARMVDRTVMVVRWRYTPEATFVSAVQRLAEDGIPLDGVVLSRVDREKYRMYGYRDSEMFSRRFKKYEAA